MQITTADQKRRIVLPNARPGEMFAVKEVEAGHYELSKVVPLPRSPRPGKREVEERLETHRLTPRMSWEALRKETREL